MLNPKGNANKEKGYDVDDTLTYIIALPRGGPFCRDFFLFFLISSKLFLP